MNSCIPNLEILSDNLYFFILQQISVYPRIEQPENPNSFKARRREYFRLQRERKKARKEGVLPSQVVLASAEDVSETNPAC